MLQQQLGIGRKNEVPSCAVLFLDPLHALHVHDLYCLPSLQSSPDPQALPVSFNFYSYFWHAFFLTESSGCVHNPSGEELMQPRADQPLPYCPEKKHSFSNRISCPAWQALNNFHTLIGKS